MSVSDPKETPRFKPGVPASAARLRLALSFLVILPTAPRARSDLAEVEASFGYFPLAGFLIGFFLSGVDWVLSSWFSLELRSLLVVLSLTALTGALHLDGLADTADAIGAGGDRTRALEIMRDSHLGAYGVVAVFFDLALKSLSLAAIYSTSGRLAALILAPGLARFAMVAVSHDLDYLRSSGAGSPFLLSPSSARRNLLISSLITVGGCLIAGILQPRLTILAFAFSIAASVLIRFLYRRWMGGITGDMIGAGGETVELLVWLIFAAGAGQAMVSV